MDASHIYVGLWVFTKKLNLQIAVEFVCLHTSAHSDSVLVPAFITKCGISVKLHVTVEHHWKLVCTQHTGAEFKGQGHIMVWKCIVWNISNLQRQVLLESPLCLIIILLSFTWNTVINCSLWATSACRCFLFENYMLADCSSRNS